MKSAKRLGRPPIGPAFVIRAPRELVERIDAAAARQGITRAEWIRRHLTAAIEEEER